MERSVLALYVDLENLPKDLDMEAMMRTLVMEDPHAESSVFAVKAAFGSADTVPKTTRQQLRDNNFHIVDTPHVAQKKNRADLIISIDAFEKLYLDNPAITRFVFVTSDSDFSVIMDRLRAYGKEVWLVCRKTDEAKAVLSHSCDNMLLLEDFTKAKATAAEREDADQKAEDLFLEALGFIDMDRLPVKLSVVGHKMKLSDRSFEIKTTSFKKLATLAARFEEKGIIKTGVDEDDLPQIEDMTLPEQ
ncbi:MAG: NYN domain-containing protein [Kiritimatiellae bacterium]|nr:NYN domain-containing protein [Kiritimatiellia bacterium]